MTIDGFPSVQSEGPTAPALAIVPKTTASGQTRSESIVSRFADFWLLGGASIVVWAVMVMGQFARSRSEVVENHFMQVAAVFGMMSLFCNHPHFMLSYRFGYGRGLKFILSHWFSLIAVPAGLLIRSLKLSAQ